MKRLLTLLVDHPSAWAFANPVNAAEVTDYYDVIKQPMGACSFWRASLGTGRS
jgi:histone acetyltransferase